MSNSCPIELSGKYIEVGEVKRASFQTKECAFVEVWLTSCFHRNCVREACKNPVRRPVWEVVRQVRGLFGDKPGCVVFQCDDGKWDTVLWGGGISLLLAGLEWDGGLPHSVLYVRASQAETAQFVAETPWRTEKDRAEVLSLLDSVSAVVYGAANSCQTREETAVHVNTAELPTAVEEYVRERLRDG